MDIRLFERIKYISTDIREYMDICGYLWISVDIRGYLCTLSMYTLPGYFTGLENHFREGGGSNIRVGYPNAPLLHTFSDATTTESSTG